VLVDGYVGSVAGLSERLDGRHNRRGHRLRSGHVVNLLARLPSQFVG
jgi:hypothetical protein